MGLEKKAICRIIIKSPNSRTHFWSGTVYEDGSLNNVKDIVDRIKEVLE